MSRSVVLNFWIPSISSFGFILFNAFCFFILLWICLLTFWQYMIHFNTLHRIFYCWETKGRSLTIWLLAMWNLFLCVCVCVFVGVSLPVVGGRLRECTAVWRREPAPSERRKKTRDVFHSCLIDLNEQQNISDQRMEVGDCQGGNIETFHCAPNRFFLFWCSSLMYFSLLRKVSILSSSFSD